MASAIHVRDLRRHFETGPRRSRRIVEAVDGISFDVEAGERLAFIGPNGAGKSTSIKMLTGILHPNEGHAEVLGLVPWRERRALAERIGSLFGQRSQLWSELAPRDSFAMLGAIFGLDAAATERRVDALTEMFELGELVDQPSRTHSLGQRMRCELAACMIHEPELLFLDEPTIGLDLVAKQRFREVLVRLNEVYGTTVFLTSHDVADIEHVADRAIIVNHGAIVRDEPVEALRRSVLTTKRVRVGVDHGSDLAAVTDLDLVGVVSSVPAPAVVRLDVDTGATPIAAVLERVFALVPNADVSVLDPPLEDIIAEIYERPA